MTFQSLLHPSIGTTDLVELLSHEDWTLVNMYLKSSYARSAATRWTTIRGFFDGEFDSRVLPIHQACALRPPKEVVDQLARCYQEGLKLKEDAFNRLPLHIACLTSAPVEVVESLLRNYPEGARCKDSIGRLPIHYACAHDVEEEVIVMLLRAFPASAGCGDNNGWLPLHVACRRGLSVNVVRQLIHCFPPSIDMPTKKGSTALMCARKGGTDRKHLDVVDLLNEELMKQSNIGWGKKVEDENQVAIGLCTLRHRHVHAKGA
ncbi:hypothetical protein ACHAWO_012706 [Cyclotella atomus]|uniref:Ankyrin n=1 Tax=Cyclotella atomus TaxID=382360 RepID=A0ABD3Q1J9_9STRA